MIIAAYAGAGKTTAAKLHPETVVDFVCMPYKYILESLLEGADSESRKANPDHVMREDWPWNYLAAIKGAMSGEKILLIPTDLNVLLLLRNDKIPYTLCYPEREARENYRQRFIARGNTDEFIEIFIGGWEERIAALEQDTYGKHIVLRDWEFLSDVIENINS